MSEDIKGSRHVADIGVRFTDELSLMDEALYAAYRRGAKDLATDMVNQAQKVALDRGVNVFDVKLGYLLIDALDSVKNETKQ